MSRFSASASISPAHPPAVCSSHPPSGAEAAVAMVSVTSSPSRSARGSRGRRVPPEKRALIVAPIRLSLSSPTLEELYHAGGGGLSLRLTFFDLAAPHFRLGPGLSGHGGRRS